MGSVYTDTLTITITITTQLERLGAPKSRQESISVYRSTTYDYETVYIQNSQLAVNQQIATATITPPPPPRKQLPDLRARRLLQEIATGDQKSRFWNYDSEAQYRAEYPPSNR